jgi:hypothetical protein
MSLSPFTAQVVCIGLIFAQKNEFGELEIKAKSAFSASNSFDADTPLEKTELADGTINLTGNEKVILEKFWKTLEGHPRAILLSFNGRNFAHKPFSRCSDMLRRCFRCAIQRYTK